MGQNKIHETINHNQNETIKIRKSGIKDFFIPNKNLIAYARFSDFESSCDQNPACDHNARACDQNRFAAKLQKGPIKKRKC